MSVGRAVQALIFWHLSSSSSPRRKDAAGDGDTVFDRLLHCLGFDLGLNGVLDLPVWGFARDESRNTRVVASRGSFKPCRADKCVLASSGFQADVKALQKVLASRHLIYQHQHNKQMSCPAMAQLLSNTLYYKRFFPYYSHNVLGGLDNEGKGCVFTYDPVGSYERVGYSSQGSGSTLIMPFLDNQLKSPSPLLLPAQDAVTPLSESEAVDLVKTVFASAAERDIYTGDKVEIVIFNSDGIRQEYMDLRKD